MYDDEYEIEEEDDSGEIGDDAARAAYEVKGKDDRAFVDSQAKEYDDMKRKKREEVTKLKSERNSAQFKLSAKERELSALRLVIRKDEYLETRERVKETREEAERQEEATREEKADTEVAEIARDSERADREREYADLERECAALKAHVDELSRRISLVEYEIIRS